MEGGLLEGGCWTEIEREKIPLHVRARNKFMDSARGAFDFKQKASGKELGRTAYLDGLRGFAALLVYFQHHNLWVHLGGHQLENGFGYNSKYFFSTLPFIRIFFTGGHLAVTVFFVISGYVLSSKPLSLIHSGQQEKLGENIASALFRRWLRLYIPVIATTFLYLTSWHAFGIWTQSEDRERTYGDEIYKWYLEIKNFTFVFNTGGVPWFSYNRHLWSIPVEFRGSMLIYTSSLAFSRCTRNARLWCQAALMFYFLYVVDGSHCAMFMMGMFLCDLDLLEQSDNLPARLKRLAPFQSVIYYHLLAIGLYLGGIPSETSDVKVLKKSYGWYLLSFLKPQAVFDYKWFYLFWASAMTVACTSRIAWLRSFFENGFNQHLGRISFGLYLVHGPLLKIFGDRVYAAVGWVNESNKKAIPGWVNLLPLPKSGPMGLELSLLIPQIVLLPITLWTADLVTRAIDKPSVKFAQWLYGKTLAAPVSLKS